MRKIGRWQDRDVREVVLESSHAAVYVMSYGGVIRDWRVDAAGGARPMVLGYPSFDSYPDHSRHFGAITGRVANRTAGGRFTLDGQAYQLEVNRPPNHLHGGSAGLGIANWEMERDGDQAVRLTHHSPDGAAGYPGAVTFTATYRLDGPALTLEIAAEADRPTPINIAQHNYYTLGSMAGIRDCTLTIRADRYTPTDAVQIPTGEMSDVAGTRFDFREPRSLAEADPEGLGIDHNLVLEDGRDAEAPAAEAHNPETDLTLRLWTDQPGLQLFDAARFDIAEPGHDRMRMQGYPGFCLEPQHFPDSLNQPDWPSIIYGPDRPYHQRLVLEIAR